MFGVNHLAILSLTNALLDCLTASAPARVVTVSSDSHYSARGIDFEALRLPERGVTGMHGYGVSKLCNVLFSQELARRTAGSGVTTYALHPGVVASDIWRRVPWPIRPLMMRRMLTVDQGAATSLYCATSPDVAQDSGSSTTSAPNAPRARSPPPNSPPSCGSAARSGRQRHSGGVQEASGSIWRSIRLGARRPARRMPVFRRAIAAGEVIPLRRVAR